MNTNCRFKVFNIYSSIKYEKDLWDSTPSQICYQLLSYTFNSVIALLWHCDGNYHCPHGNRLNIFIFIFLDYHDIRYYDYNYHVLLTFCGLS